MNHGEHLTPTMILTQYGALTLIVLIRCVNSLPSTRHMYTAELFLKEMGTLPCAHICQSCKNNESYTDKSDIGTTNLLSENRALTRDKSVD